MQIQVDWLAFCFCLPRAGITGILLKLVLGYAETKLIREISKAHQAYMCMIYIYIFYTYFNHRNYSRDWKFQNEWHIESETSESRGGEVIENRVYKDAEKGENDVIKVLSGWGHKRNNLLSLGISKIQALNDDI